MFQFLLEHEDGIGILPDTAQNQLTQEIGSRAQDPSGNGLDAGLEPPHFPGVLDSALEFGVELLRLADSSPDAGQGLLHLSLALSRVLGDGTVGSGQPETRLFIRLQLFVEFPPYIISAQGEYTEQKEPCRKRLRSSRCPQRVRDYDYVYITQPAVQTDRILFFVVFVVFFFKPN